MKKLLINEPRIDLACGDNKKEGFVGIDIIKTNCTDYIVDLQRFPWPIESESVEEIFCGHYIEHIPHDSGVKEAIEEATTFEEFKELYKEKSKVDGFIKFLNELYRILKPEGKARLIAPYYTSERAYGDPTHVRYIADFTCYYMNRIWMKECHLEHYGMNCNFDVSLSYAITNEMTLKSEEVRNNAFLHDWNVISDIIIDLVKK